MSVLSTIIGVIVCGLIVPAIGKMYYQIYQDIKKYNLNATKYKVSFKKYTNVFEVPLIKMKINGKLQYFIIDSGAENNVLTNATFKSLNPQSYTKLDIEDSIVTASGTTDKVPFIEMDLSYKKEVYNDVVFVVSDLTEAINYIKNKTNITIAGLLGSHFFHKYRWAIDFDERCVWINNTNAKHEKI